jgi:hypothetical protein
LADDRDQVTLAAHLHPEDAEPALFVVEGDPLDEAGQVLLWLEMATRVRRPFHEPRRSRMT